MNTSREMGRPPAALSMGIGETIRRIEELPNGPAILDDRLQWEVKCQDPKQETWVRVWIRY